MTGLFTSLSMDRLAQLAWMHCWQLAALAAVVFLIARLACRRHPHVAYLLWMLVVLKALVPPLWSSPSGAFSWALAETRSTTLPSPRLLVAENGLSLLPAQIPTETVAPALNTATETPIDWAQLSLWALAGLWVTGVLVLATAAAVRWIRLKRLLANTTVKVDPEVSQAFDRLAQKIVPGRRVCLIPTSAPIGPAAFGWWRGTVVVPTEILAGKTAEELSPILAHELIHLRRHDTLAGSVQLLAQCLWWFHPAVWVANRQARFERERACDEAVVAEVACTPAGYARLLVQILEWRQQLPVPLAWPSMRGLDVTTERLQSMLRPARSFRSRAPRWSWVVMLAVAALALPGAGLQRLSTAEPENNKESSNTGTTVTGTYTTEGDAVFSYFADPRVPEVPAELRPVLDELEKQGLKLYPNLQKDKLAFTGVFTKEFKKREQPFALDTIPNLVHVELATHEDASAERVEDKLRSVQKLGPETMLSFACRAELGAAFNRLAEIPGLRKLMLTESPPPLVAAGQPGRTLRLDALQLKALTLSSANDDLLAETAGLKQLEDLQVFGKISEVGLAHLAGLTSLKSLFFAHHSPGEPQKSIPIDLPWVERLINLENIFVGSDFGLSDAGAARLAKLPKLLRLQCDVAMTDAGLASVAQSQSVRLLTLQFTSATTKVTAKGLKALAGLQQLRQLNLYRQQSEATPPLVTDEVLNAWAAWTDLRVLVLAECQLTDASAGAIRSWRKLQSLDLYGDVQFTDAGTAGWSPTLRRLTLPIPKLTDRGVTEFGKLTKLRGLELPRAEQITDAALPALKPLAQLTSLSISGAKFTGPQALALGQWPLLQQLVLANCRLGNDAFRGISELAKLHSLSLADTGTGNAQLKLLRPLAGLRSLGLENNPIDDEGLNSLSEWKSLQELRLADTKTTPEGRKKFVEAHPKVSVNDGLGLQWSVNSFITFGAQIDPLEDEPAEAP